jgi:hypothetical protein
MIDGIFAVAITLSQTAPPITQHQGGPEHFVLIATTLLLITLTMMLLWLKLRTIVQLKGRLQNTDVALITIILIVAVLIPQSGKQAIDAGQVEGSIWQWSHSQWVNLEYQGLLLMVEGGLLLLSWRTMGTANALAYPRSLRRWILGVEIMGFTCLTFVILIDNIWHGINGPYLYVVPVILLLEEALCLARMKGFRSQGASPGLTYGTDREDAIGAGNGDSRGELGGEINPNDSSALTGQQRQDKRHNRH